PFGGHQQVTHNGLATGEAGGRAAGQRDAKAALDDAGAVGLDLQQLAVDKFAITSQGDQVAAGDGDSQANLRRAVGFGGVVQNGAVVVGATDLVGAQALC